MNIGITEPKYAILDDGSQIVVKLSHGSEGNLVLFNEYVCYRLAILIDIPMPYCGICVMDENTEVFANEFKFSTIKKLNVGENEDYVDALTKVYLKYDLAKSQRLNRNEEKKLIKCVLETNNLEYSNGRISGEFNDEIPFDYQLENLCIKHFSFKGKNLRRVISNARQWSFAASEMAGVKKVLFIYDSDFEDRDNLKIIINILSKHAEVLQMDEGMDYILKSCIR